MSPGLLRRARYWYGTFGISTGVTQVPMYNECGRYIGMATTGVSVIRGMSSLIQGPGTPADGVY